MRILSVSNCPLDPNLGSGYGIVGYAQQVRARGHELDLLGPEHYEWLPRLRVGKRLRILCGYSIATLRALRRKHYDVAEFWGAEAWWVLRRLARRATRPLLVARSNGLEGHLERSMAEQAGGPERRGAIAQRFDAMQDYEAAFRCADLLTTLSEFDRRFALARGYLPADRVLALENPLPDEWLDAPATVERRPIIGYFGSWLPRKGSDLIVAALPTVLRAHPGWRFRLVGVGDLDRESAFPSDVAARVEVIPFVGDRAQLRALYDETAIAIMPSRYESFGMVAAEAMARGCALVARRTGLAADVVAGKEAAVLDSASPAEWSRVIGELALDADRRAALASAGRQRVQTLRWGPAVARLIATYETRLARRSARGEMAVQP